MQTTPDKPSLGDRPTSELVDDLCLALRNVGVFDNDLPSGKRVISHIEDVKAIYQELAKRRIDLSNDLAKLSEQTSWQMSSLLEECLSFPKTLPYVKESDGIRRRLRCQLCAQRERPIDAKLFWFCDACMQQALDVVRARKPANGLILFRTYNAECRCIHADGETVLITHEIYGGLNGACEQCLIEELEQRKRTT